ncbi:MAG: hypothetical protein RBS40_01910 [Rhodocyclaceae bacterium]|nr:hypothetical protein [Rhodocyclaceae bacterium]
MACRFDPATLVATLAAQLRPGSQPVQISAEARDLDPASSSKRRRPGT